MFNDQVIIVVIFKSKVTYVERKFNFKELDFLSVLPLDINPRKIFSRLFFCLFRNHKFKL